MRFLWPLITFMFAAIPIMADKPRPIIEFLDAQTPLDYQGMLDPFYPGCYPSEYKTQVLNIVIVKDSDITDTEAAIVTHGIKYAMYKQLNLALNLEYTVDHDFDCKDKFDIIRIFRDWVLLNNDLNIHHWHLLTKCTRDGSGEAYVGTICNKDGYNTATTSHTNWRVFGHELGHGLGASHSFERGKRRTGGIMDYGDGTLNGYYQFNKQFRRTEMCKAITKFTQCGKKLEVVDACGNGVLEDTEECECTRLTQNCTGCIGCVRSKECGVFTIDNKNIFHPNCCVNNTALSTGSCKSGSCHGGFCLDFCPSNFVYHDLKSPCIQKCKYKTGISIYEYGYAPYGTSCTDNVHACNYNGSCVRGLTKYPTNFPTIKPTRYPTAFPTPPPTMFPTTLYPTMFPTTLYPTNFPTPYPTKIKI